MPPAPRDWQWSRNSMVSFGRPAVRYDVVQTPIDVFLGTAAAASGSASAVANLRLVISLGDLISFQYSIPGLAIGANQHFRGFGIADDGFFGGVPVELAAQGQAGISEWAGGGDMSAALGIG